MYLGGFVGVRRAKRDWLPNACLVGVRPIITLLQD
jgi:hypothetical protein